MSSLFKSPLQNGNMACANSWNIRRTKGDKATDVQSIMLTQRSPYSVGCQGTLFHQGVCSGPPSLHATGGQHACVLSSLPGSLLLPQRRAAAEGDEELLKAVPWSARQSCLSPQSCIIWAWLLGHLLAPRPAGTRGHDSQLPAASLAASVRPRTCFQCNLLVWVCFLLTLSPFSPAPPIAKAPPRGSTGK